MEPVLDTPEHYGLCTYEAFKSRVTETISEDNVLRPKMFLGEWEKMLHVPARELTVLPERAEGEMRKLENAEIMQSLASRESQSEGDDDLNIDDKVYVTKVEDYQFLMEHAADPTALMEYTEKNISEAEEKKSCEELFDSLVHRALTKFWKRLRQIPLSHYLDSVERAHPLRELGPCDLDAASATSFAILHACTMMASPSGLENQADLEEVDGKKEKVLSYLDLSSVGAGFEDFAISSKEKRVKGIMVQPPPSGHLNLLEQGDDPMVSLGDRLATKYEASARVERVQCDVFKNGEEHEISEAIERVGRIGLVVGCSSIVTARVALMKRLVQLKAFVMEKRDGGIADIPFSDITDDELYNLCTVVLERTNILMSFVVSLQHLTKKGHLLLRLFDLGDPLVISIIPVLHSCFGKLSIYRPRNEPLNSRSCYLYCMFFNKTFSGPVMNATAWVRGQLQLLDSNLRDFRSFMEVELQDGASSRCIELWTSCISALKIASCLRVAPVSDWTEGGLAHKFIRDNLRRLEWAHLQFLVGKKAAHDIKESAGNEEVDKIADEVATSGYYKSESVRGLFYFLYEPRAQVTEHSALVLGAIQKFGLRDKSQFRGRHKDKNEDKSKDSNKQDRASVPRRRRVVVAHKPAEKRQKVEIDPSKLAKYKASA